MNLNIKRITPDGRSNAYVEFNDGTIVRVLNAGWVWYVL